MAKLSGAMLGALASVYNSATPGKKNTMDALESRGLITYKSGQVVITAEGRKAIDADNDLIGVQSCGSVLYGSVQAYNRRMEQEIEAPSKPTKLGLTDDHGMADWELELLNLAREQAERFDASLDVYSNNLLGFGEVYKWSNFKVWNGLNAQEIRKDMDTAAPINRAARRKGQKISRRFLKALSKVS